MFLNDLFSIVKLTSTTETISADIKIDSNHRVFEGHFPGSPVTPGVIQLQIVKEILEDCLQRKLTLKNMKTSKFLQVINPKETPVVHFEIKFVQSEFLDVVATGTSGGLAFLKTQISYL